MPVVTLTPDKPNERARDLGRKVLDGLVMLTFSGGIRVEKLCGAARNFPPVTRCNSPAKPFDGTQAAYVGIAPYGITAERGLYNR